MKEETLSKECLWKSVWQAIIEAVILYSDTEDDANHNEANLITILQQTIPLLRKRSNFHFDDRVQELGFAEALRDLALKYESKDRFIRTKLMIIVRMVDDHWKWKVSSHRMIVDDTLQRRKEQNTKHIITENETLIQ